MKRIKIVITDTEDDAAAQVIGPFDADEYQIECQNEFETLSFALWPDEHVLMAQHISITIRPPVRWPRAQDRVQWKSDVRQAAAGQGAAHGAPRSARRPDRLGR